MTVLKWPNQPGFRYSDGSFSHGARPTPDGSPTGKVASVAEAFAEDGREHLFFVTVLDGRAKHRSANGAALCAWGLTRLLEDALGPGP
jgi:hypothetical protein